MARSPKIPVVLVIAGNDPSGGAGLCADIQTVSALGCHSAPVITALTVQDTHNAYQVESISPDLVISQICAVLNDLPVAAIKLGLLGRAATGKAVATILAEFLEIPVIIEINASVFCEPDRLDLPRRRDRRRGRNSVDDDAKSSSSS